MSSRLFDHGLQLGTESIAAARITPPLREEWLHRFEYLRPERGRGIVVQVDHGKIKANAATLSRNRGLIATQGLCRSCYEWTAAPKT